MDHVGAGAHEAIERHVEEHFGAIEFVFHAVPSTGVHVLVVGPSEDRPSRTLVTQGMSDLPMTVPDGLVTPTPTSGVFARSPKTIRAPSRV